MAGREGVKRIGKGLDEEENTRQNQYDAQGLYETVALTETAPEGSRNGAGKTAQGEDKAGYEDQVVDVSGKVRNIGR